MSEIVTKADLAEFKKQLIGEFKELLDSAPSKPNRRWIKTYRVKQMLDLSDGTLQTLRNNGTLPYTLLGGVALYDYEELVALMDKNRQLHRKNFKDR
jgi:hypothetical protein